ncbi:hypothetical protein CDV31_000379 [Fusarium ambrosium]|uniref:Transcription factor domain-containing protein n=1 Tax=Fusarium ambrosium TaxID=131363 RepID=A0A428V2E4_9HYPO|nr:hypothetical protein CDV31_000379 [Fusarium ambrosium]
MNANVRLDPPFHLCLLIQRPLPSTLPKHQTSFEYLTYWNLESKSLSQHQIPCRLESFSVREKIKSSLRVKLQALVPSYQFPVVPICHEPSLWQSANQFFKNPELEAAAGQDTLTSLRPYTLLSALCACITSTHRDGVIGPQTMAVASAFYASSRETFKLYEDTDLEYTDSSSLSIRTLHSIVI